MNKGRVYLAGPVTDLDPEMVKYRFASCQQKLEDLGYDVVNPVQFIEDLGAKKHVDLSTWEWKDYMRVCMIELLQCEKLYLMPGWEKSKGATVERNVAMSVEIPVFYL